MKLYVYDESGGSAIKFTGDWPGTSMQKLADGYYKYVFDRDIGSNWRVLFNSGGEQIPGSGQPGWKVINGAVYQFTNSESEAVIEVLTAEDCTVTDINSIAEDGLQIYQTQNALILKSNVITEANIYNTLGQRVSKLLLMPDTEHYIALPKGIYLINNQKVLVK